MGGCLLFYEHKLYYVLFISAIYQEDCGGDNKWGIEMCFPTPEFEFTISDCVN